MPQLVIASVATAVPMGAQIYQEEIASRAAAGLRDADPDRGWSVTRSVVRSLRSPLPGNRRLPMGLVTERGPRLRRLAGRAVYPAGALVHRMSLDLPPAGHEVVTLHDTVSWTFEDESAPVPAAGAELRRAAAVICVSEYTAIQATKLLGLDQPVVIPNGVAARFFDASPLTEQERARLALPRAYVLHMGGAARRKNLEALAGAWPTVAALFPDVELVLAGPPHPRRTQLFDGMAGVHLLGRVDDSFLGGLVASASTVVVPSLIEGFGLPALEAMAARTPLVAAATSSLPEVVGDGGLLVAPTVPGLVAGLEAALLGGTDIESMVARGRERAGLYTWDRSGLEHARVWASVL